MLGAGALGWPRGMVWGRRREGGSGWGTRVYLWWIHVDVWQNQYNAVFILPYIDMNHPWVYMSSQSWTPSHLAPCIISLDHPGAPAPSILYPVSNLDWRFISYMTVYMFQCHSPKSSHPLPLSQSPKVCSLHLCLFCCLQYWVIITIFLNSIYMC